MSKKYFLKTAALLLTAGLILLPVSCLSMQEDMMYKAVVARLEENMLVSYIPDAMEIVVTGSGGPMPNDERRPPSITVKVNEKVYLFDAGQGTDLAMRENNIPMGDLDAVFLTHFHSDHIAGLGEVKLNSWTTGREEPINVYGPTGLNDLIEGLTRFYAFDTSYRLAHHPEAVVKERASRFVPHEFDSPEEGEFETVFEEGDFRVIAFKVNHDPVKPAVGYRLEYKDKAAIITGDTVYTENLVEASRGADVIFADALDHELTMMLEQAAKEVGSESVMWIARDIREYQMDPVDCARLARDAGAKRLVLVHVTPPIISEIQKRIYIEGIKEVFNGEYEIGYDGLRVVLR